MLNNLYFLIVASLFPLSVFAMDDEKPAEIIAQQDKDYKKSLLTDLKKDWHKTQTQFKDEFEGLQALLGEISALVKARNSDAERNKQFSNPNLQKSIEQTAKKIDQSRHDLKLFIQSHQSRFTELATQLHNIFQTMEDQQIQDDEFVSQWRPFLDYLNHYLGKVKRKKTPAHSSPVLASGGISPQSVSVRHKPGNEAPEDFMGIASIAQESFGSDKGAMAEDEKFQTDGKFDEKKANKFIMGAREKFSKCIRAARVDYDKKNYAQAFKIFSTIESILTKNDWPSETAKNYKKEVQSYLGFMYKNGCGVKADQKRAYKRFQAVATFLDKKFVQNLKGNFIEDKDLKTIKPICIEAVYELSRMCQYGEGTAINLFQVVKFLEIAAAAQHKIAIKELHTICNYRFLNGNMCEMLTYLEQFKKFEEVEEVKLSAHEAYFVSKVVEKHAEEKNAYKWLAIAACGDCLEAKYDIGVLFLLCSSNWQICQQFADLRCRMDNSFQDIADDDPFFANLPRDNNSLRVIAFCLLSDAAAQGHDKSQTKIVEKFSNQMPIVTLSEPISWHLKNVRERLPAVAQYKFPNLSGPDPVLELFLCCVDLPTEVINLILEKVPPSLPEPPKKS